jgi:hypothetical protein
MWSVGCVMAELLSRKPLFQGKDYVEMLKLISEKAIKFLAGSHFFFLFFFGHPN